MDRLVLAQRRNCAMVVFWSDLEPLRHCARKFLFILILTCSVSFQSANSQTQTHRKIKPTPEPTLQVSPVPSLGAPLIATPQVAAEAMQLNQQLRTLPERVVSKEALVQLEQQVNSLKATVDEKAQKTEQAIQSGAIFTELQQLSLDWDALNQQVESLSETLTKHATSLESEARTLKNAESRWLATDQAAETQQ